MTITKKYVVHPGWVRSREPSRQVLHIGFSQLACLYGIDPEDCVDADVINQIGLDYHDRAIHLFPRYDGDYSLPVNARAA